MSLKTEFKDREYRRAYAESFANTVIATQIRLLRGAMSQSDFADLVGVHQSRVSAMEDENYSAWSTKTLKKLAASKDVVFLGRFVSFGELLDWSRELSEASLSVLPYELDPKVREETAHSDIAAGNVLTFRPRIAETYMPSITSSDDRTHCNSITSTITAPRQVANYAQAAIR